jgi:8-oxo-dGTP pyrophosphatase MutT (NUDIX family)
MATDASNPRTKRVVTCFLLRHSRILILKRSQRVSTFKEKWAAVSGYIECDTDSQSLTEIEEETGFSPADVKLLKTGRPLEVNDAQNGVLWIIHPYLYKVVTDKPVRIDWEHNEFRWIEPAELGNFETVPGLAEALSSVMQG